MALNGNSWTNPPAINELEVSIFGPGFGECIVLHFGNGDWSVIDSCLDPIAKRPASLAYLQAIGIDVVQGVKFVVSTHWHDDHIHGLAEVFRAAKNATFICSAVIKSPQFSQVMATWTGNQDLPGGSGVGELKAIMVELKKRSPSGRFPAPILASNDKIIWARNENPKAFVRALSPSDASVIASLADLVKQDPLSAKMRRRIPDIKPNDSSVVLLFQVGEHRVLLGADLEYRQDPAFGWIAIVANVSAGEPKSHGFKVSHHGSSTGHHEDVWQKMLVEDVWAVTTPFVHGSVKLPTPDDCRRIDKYTNNAFLTAPPKSTKFRDPNRTVEKTVVEFAKSIQVIPGKYGHVRLRKNIADPIASPWAVELFGDAIRIRDYLKTLS